MRDPFSTVSEAVTVDRRTLLCRAGLGGASLMMGGLLGGCGGSDHHSSNGSDPTDVDVLNFALNLEYLEASYYTIGANEFTLSDADVTGSGTAGTVAGGRAANLGGIAPYVREIAFDESNHVRAIRAAITARGGTPVARPTIDLSAIAAAGQAAGIAGFDPFADDVSFLLGGFMLSDVGATAYVGGAQFLNAADVKLAAARILAVEGYHVGSIRTLINQAGATAILNSQKISDARDALDGSVDDDQGAGQGSDPEDAGFPNIAPTNAQGLAFPRTFSQVLAIVYANPTPNTDGGGLFPTGVNGRIRTVGSLA